MTDIDLVTDDEDRQHGPKRGTISKAFAASNKCTGAQNQNQNQNHCGA
jgi:hypothetical protein